MPLSTRASKRNAEGQPLAPPRKRVPTAVRQIREPYCTDFGEEREKIFNGYHFCSKCSDFEVEKSIKPSLTRESNLKRFKCDAGHTSFDYPTVKIKIWCRNQKEIKIAEEEEEKCSSASSRAGRPYAPKQLGIASYLDKLFQEKEKVVTQAQKIQAKYQYLLEEKKNLKARIAFLEKKVKHTNEQATQVEISKEDRDLSKTVREALINIISTNYYRYGEKRVAREISDVVWSSSFFNGVVRDELIKRAKLVIKDTFSPQNILKEMDLSSGSLNLAGVEIMQKVEGLMKREKGIFPSLSQI